MNSFLGTSVSSDKRDQFLSADESPAACRPGVDGLLPADCGPWKHGIAKHMTKLRTKFSWPLVFKFIVYFMAGECKPFL